MAKIDDIFTVDTHDPILQGLSQDQIAWLVRAWNEIKAKDDSLDCYVQLFSLLRSVSQSQDAADQRFKPLIESDYFRFITTVNAGKDFTRFINIELDENLIKSVLLAKLSDAGTVARFTTHNQLAAAGYPINDYATALASMKKLWSDVKARLIAREQVNIDQYEGTKLFFIRKSYPLRSGSKVILQKLIAWLFDGSDFEATGRRPNNVAVAKLPNPEKQKAAIKALIAASRNFGSLASRKADAVQTITSFIESYAPDIPGPLKNLKNENDYRRLYDSLLNFAENIFADAKVKDFFKELFWSCPTLLRNGAGDVVVPGIRAFLSRLRDAYLLDDIESATIDLDYDRNIYLYRNSVVNDLLTEADRILENLPLVRKNQNPLATEVLSQATEVKLHQILWDNTLSGGGGTSDWPTPRPHFGIGVGQAGNQIHINAYAYERNALFFEDRQDPHMAWLADPAFHDGRLIGVNFKDYKIGPAVFQNRQAFKSALEAKFPGRDGKPYFKTRRQWHCLYDSGNNTSFLSEAKGGGGHGIGRADDASPLTAHSYVHFDGALPLGKLQELNAALSKQLTVQQVGRALALFLTRPLVQWIVGGDISADLKSEPMSNDFVKTLYEDKFGDSFVSTNTPSSAKKILARVVGETDGASLILDLFRFNYFRRLNDRGQVIKEDQKNRPLDKKMNLPIDFKAPENYKKLHEIKPKARRVIKNKGRRVFYRGPASRLNAGSVMKEIVSHIKSQAPYLQIRTKFTGQNNLSATKFAEAVFEADAGARSDWQDLKGRPLATLPTDQEWCHLKGHGGGGLERIGNFVSGSNHCNTEQLAIETGHRRVTLEANNYILKSTAYLVNNTAMKSTSNYLLLDPEVRTDATKVRKNTEKRLGQIEAAKESAPVVAFIRYRIFKIVGQTEHKLFDHTFEGQSEFFDKNQYNILNHTVYFMLAGWDKFKDWFVDRYENG